VWFALRRAGVRIRSVQDDSNLEDAIRVVLIGERNHEDRKRKSAATRSGLKRRAERGEPVGAIPEGYRVDTTVEKGSAVTRRVVDPDRAPLVGRIFDLVEAGHTFGDVARALNADAIRTRRGKTWSTRAVRRTVLNEDYTGSTGYPPLVEPERHARILAGLKRLSARQTGRAPVEDYLLRGVGFCGLCGQSLCTRRYASGRHYPCAAVREARGTCNAQPIPAGLVEGRVVEHLEHFFGDVADWIAQRADEGNAERARFADTIEAQRIQLRKLQVRADRARATYHELLDAGDDLAAEALREASRINRDAEGLQDALHAAQQRLEEWPAPPEVDVALDFYRELVDTIDGRIRAARSVRDVNASLRTVLEGAWLHIDAGGLHGRFTLRASGDVPTTWVLSEPLPDMDPDELCVIPACQTGPQTLV
jgi:hypothetical protein